MTITNSQVKLGVKLLTKFFRDYRKRDPDEDNQTFCKRCGYTTASFYSNRKRLVDMGKLGANYQVLANTWPITTDEYRKFPYPYGKWERRIGKKKRANRKSNGKAKSNELLTEELTFPVREKDNITITLQEFTKVLIGLVREGYIK